MAKFHCQRSHLEKQSTNNLEVNLQASGNIRIPKVFLAWALTLTAISGVVPWFDVHLDLKANIDLKSQSSGDSEQAIPNQ